MGKISGPVKPKRLVAAFRQAAGRYTRAGSPNDASSEPGSSLQAWPKMPMGSAVGKHKAARPSHGAASSSERPPGRSRAVSLPPAVTGKGSPAKFPTTLPGSHDRFGLLYTTEAPSVCPIPGQKCGRPLHPARQQKRPSNLTAFHKSRTGNQALRRRKIRMMPNPPSNPSKAVDGSGTTAIT